MSRIAKAAAVTLGTGAIVLGGSGLASADAGAQGSAVGSPGVLSGNLLQVPIHVPINLCGNTVDIIGVLNPAFGNTCINNGGGHHKDNGHHNGHGKGHHGKGHDKGHGKGHGKGKGHHGGGHHKGGYGG
ncbi:chaplin [Streptomyces sp. WAC 01529]|uniref:chaplin n=1 Tax=Streptomyces sp. WAC 01529 TaxID=2203205 RepID=UPI000F6BF6F9|nr:chaplin [Streptomyces sp. WAC 01529]AZM54533.1 chaplin [Streptomyces sp. WAC 01529]